MMWGVLTEIFFSPEDKVGVIILTNGGDYFGSWYTDVIAIENAILDYGYEYLALHQEINVNYNAGWNIVGLPLGVEDTQYQTLFPEAYTGALYSYDGSYQPETNLILGTGYLLRLAAGGVVEFTGLTINNLTLSIVEGWNLISGLSTQIDADVLYNTGLIVTNGIYEYDETYINAETIDPGKGYWVRANNSGSIILTSE